MNLQGSRPLFVQKSRKKTLKRYSVRSMHIVIVCGNRTKVVRLRRPRVREGKSTRHRVYVPGTP